ncbi:MAG: hypothetical protein QM731_04810 [Chitinophagaceae bacterium]
MFESSPKSIPVNTTGNTGSFFAPVFRQVQNQVQQQPALPGFTSTRFIDNTFANFDADYVVDGPVPKTGTLFIKHKVFMVYPANMTPEERTTFETDFKKSIHDTWSNQHLLTLTLPGFLPYQCNVDVSVNVETDQKNAHTVINVVKPGAKEKRYRSRVSSVDKKEDSENTHTAKLDYRDPTTPEEKRTDTADRMIDVGSFDFDSAVINADCQSDIQDIKNYLNSIPDPDPASGEDCKFSLEYIGRASSEGSADYNQKLSQKRIDSVDAELSKVNGVCITIPNPIGERNAQADAEYRKVTVAIFVNKAGKTDKAQQNVAAHEFGHMIGLGDEYVDSKPSIPNTLPKEKGDKPKHYEAVKEGVDQAAADELLVQNSDSIMAAGNTVKRGHYVAFVAALDRMTAPEMPANRPPQRVSWKVQ